MSCPQLTLPEVRLVRASCNYALVPLLLRHANYRDRESAITYWLAYIVRIYIVQETRVEVKIRTA